MKNLVSSRLTEATVGEVLTHLYQPYMDTFDEDGLERMCALNEAYVVVLLRKALITPDIAENLLSGIEKLRQRGLDGIDRTLISS